MLQLCQSCLREVTKVKAVSFYVKVVPQMSLSCLQVAWIHVFTNGAKVLSMQGDINFSSLPAGLGGYGECERK